MLLIKYERYKRKRSGTVCFGANGFGKTTICAILRSLKTADAGHVLGRKTPFNSQDAFRRRQTIHEIIKIAGKCAQILVLSHDPAFLKQVWTKCSPAERATLALADHGQFGSKIAAVDLEKACQGRTATDMDDLQAYVTHGTGQHIDVLRKMRTVLETHMQTTYPSSFNEGDWLGSIVRKIREGGRRILQRPYMTG